MIREQPRFRIDPSSIRYRKLSGSFKSALDCTDREGKDPNGVQSFIKKHAIRIQNAKLGSTHVISYKRKVIGYVTLATSSIHRNEVFKKARPRVNDGPVFPAMIILDLCIDKKSRKRGFGEHVLMWCNGMARAIYDKVGCRFVTLYADDARDFYSLHNYQLAETDQKNKFKLMYVDVFPELRERRQAV